MTANNYPTHPDSRYIYIFLLLLATLPFTSNAEVLGCGDFKGVFGPWDYYKPASHRPLSGHPMGPVKRVTNVHLTKKMFTLERGNTGAGPEGLMADLDYTLLRIPNHPQALHLLIQFNNKLNGQLPQLHDFTWKRSTECYFDRAIEFSPNNGETYALYGIYYHGQKRYSEAEKQYKIAESKGYKSADFFYNIGLLYVDLQNYELSQKYALKAYQNGYPLPGLRNRLINLGKWPESDDSQ